MLNPDAYIQRIAYTKSLDVIRRRKVAGRSEDAATLVLAAAPCARQPGGAQGEIRTALHSLSKTLRQVMVLTEIEGFTDREAALLLGIRKVTLRTRRHRAREFLRKAAAM